MTLPIRLWSAVLLCALAVGGLTACAPAEAMTPYPSPSQTVPATPEPTPTPAPTPSPEPTPTPYDYTQPAPESAEVAGEWFADAVFIGDSRTDGLRLYSGITGTDFISYKGLTSFEFDSKKCIAAGEEKVTALEALGKKDYAKVYVMLGLNELGYSVEEFSAEYSQLIDTVRAVQPNAALYFQSIIPANTQKAKEKNQPPYITNEKIAAFNAEISRLCQEKKVIFLNVSEGLTDETGEPPYEATTDGVHFTRNWYKEWYAYLRTHTVDPDTLEVVPYEEIPAETPAPPAPAEPSAVGL